MQELITEGIITEVYGFQSISYFINDEKLFVPSNYKMMRNHEDAGLMRCNRIRHNGKEKLVYSIGEMKSMDVYCRFMHYSAFVNVLCKILDIAIAVKSSGFLNISNLNFSPDHVYLDSETLSPHIMYFPLASHQTEKKAVQELRENLQKMVKDVTSVSSEARDELYGYLSNSSISLEELKTKLGRRVNGTPLNAQPVAGNAKSNETAGSGSSFQKPELRPATGNAKSNGTAGSGPSFRKPEYRPAAGNANYYETTLLSQGLKLIPVDGGQNGFDIYNSEFVIGKQSGAVNGVIPNAAVSRKHCVITCANGNYFIEDLGSTNGTKINGTKIPSHQKTGISSGDIIKIADVKYQVEI